MTHSFNQFLLTRIHMAKDQKQKKKSSTSPSFIGRFIRSTLFAVTFLAIILHLAYLYSQEPTSEPEAQYLHKMFKKEPYAAVVTGLQENKYSLIRTNCKECTSQVVKYYGSQADKIIVERDYSTLKGPEGDIMPVLWSVRALIQNYIEPKPEKQRLWLFWVSKDAPKTDIDQIKALDSEASIVLCFLTNSKTKLKQKGFKDIGKVQKFDIISALKQAKVPKKRAEVYEHFFKGDISKMFSQVSEQFLNSEQYLGDHLVEVSSLSAKARKALTKICKANPKDKAKLTEGIKEELNKVGVDIVDGQPKWRNEKSLLNFMIQTHENCTWVDKDFTEKEESVAAPEKPAEVAQKAKNQCCCCKKSKTKRSKLVKKLQDEQKDESEQNKNVTVEATTQTKQATETAQKSEQATKQQTKQEENQVQEEEEEEEKKDDKKQQTPQNQDEQQEDQEDEEDEEDKPTSTETVTEKSKTETKQVHSSQL